MKFPTDLPAMRAVQDDTWRRHASATGFPRQRVEMPPAQVDSSYEILETVRAQLVNNDTLAQIAVRYRLNHRIIALMGSNAASQSSVQAAVFEAWLAAAEREYGLDYVYEFIRDLFAQAVDEEVEHLRNDHTSAIFADFDASIDYVGRLNEYAQRSRSTIRYEERERAGPPHRPVFRMVVLVNGVEHGEGIGATLKEARAQAAAAACADLGLA